MLGSKSSTFASQFAQPFGMDCFSAGVIQAGRTKAGELIDDAQQRTVSRRAWRKPSPGQHTHRRALRWPKQRIESLGLQWRQDIGELARDATLSHDQHRRHQTFDHGWARRNDPAPTKFIHQCRGDCEGIDGGQSDRQHPSQ